MKRSATASWDGTLKGGNGTMNLEGGSYVGAYTFLSRFDEGEGTNPEELVAGAHAGCFSMALNADLEKAGHNPGHVETTATVHLETVDGKPTITKIDLVSVATMEGIDDAAFQEVAAATKENCPISRLLGPGAEITLDARLAS